MQDFIQNFLSVRAVYIVVCYWSDPDQN